MSAKNRLSICLTNALNAASDIHTTMCRIETDHPMQLQLVAALQSMLIIAEECRQGWLDPDPDKMMRRVIDITWGMALEDESVPSSVMALGIIGKAKSDEAVT